MTEDYIKELYLDEPIFKMGSGARFLVRFVTYSVYGIAGALALAMLISDIDWLRWYGVLLVLFLSDRILHVGDAEKNFVRHPSGSVNVANYFTPAARGILEMSIYKQKALGGNIYLYILQRLAARKEIVAILERLGIPMEDFLWKAGEYLQKSVEDKRGFETPKLDALAIASFNAALAIHDFAIGPKALLAGLFRVNDPDINGILDFLGITADDAENVILFVAASRAMRGLRRPPNTITGVVSTPLKVRHRKMNRAWTSRPTPILDRFGEDITDLARMEKMGFLIGHNAEYERLVDVLARPSHPNALLLGEEGMGKETIVAHLAFRIVKDRVPVQLFDKRIVLLNLGSLVSGADAAELRKRTEDIVNEVTASGNIILYIPDIHNLVKTSGPENLNVADILIPAIKSDAFSVIGATYSREFKELISPRSDFAGTFEAITVQEVTDDEAVKILLYQSVILEKQYRVIIGFDAVKKAVYLARRYFHDRPLPGGAEAILKEAVADVSGRGAKMIHGADVSTIAERKSNVPIREAGEAEAEKLLNLESTIHEYFVDQDEAVSAVSRALREYRSGLARRGGPIATFLFVGPTGVGKTELSKILADVQFGSRESMVRFDMSEYQDKQSISRFLGSPDGKISGLLTDAISERPFSLVLLDEFEKAHPDILNMFLGVFDDGRLTDNLGHLVDFQNTIIIATSNAHSDFIKNELENGRMIPEIASELKNKLTAYFRPELLNRFSGIIVFKALTLEHIEKIAVLRLKDLGERAKEAQGLELVFDLGAVSEIARLGYDPVYGARPLRSVIADKLQSVLAEKILKKELKRGQKVVCRAKKGEFIFEKQ